MSLPGSVHRFHLCCFNVGRCMCRYRLADLGCLLLAVRALQFLYVYMANEVNLTFSEEINMPLLLFFLLSLLSCLSLSGSERHWRGCNVARIPRSGLRQSRYLHRLLLHLSSLGGRRFPHRVRRSADIRRRRGPQSSAENRNRLFARNHFQIGGLRSTFRTAGNSI